MPRAIRAMEDILGNYQRVVDNMKLIPGKGGVFELMVNDKLVYSKKALGRHAEEGEVLKIFQSIVDSGDA